MCSSTAAALAVVVVTRKCCGAEPRGRAVIEQHAVLAQHDAVARAAHRQRGEGVGIDEIEEARRVRPLHVDLAERRDVGEPDRRCAPRAPPRAPAPSRPWREYTSGRSHSPVDTNVAPAASCQSCSGRRRLGLKCSRTSAPASAANGTGCA